MREIGSLVCCAFPYNIYSNKDNQTVPYCAAVFPVGADNFFIIYFSEHLYLLF